MRSIFEQHFIPVEDMFHMRRTPVLLPDADDNSQPSNWVRVFCVYSLSSEFCIWELRIRVYFNLFQSLIRIVWKNFSHYLCEYKKFIELNDNYFSSLLLVSRYETTIWMNWEIKWSVFSFDPFLYISSDDWLLILLITSSSVELLIRVFTS